jgi:hypothetical protein
LVRLEGLRKLKKKKITSSGLETAIFRSLGYAALTLYPQKVAIKFADKRRSLGRYSSTTG